MCSAKKIKCPRCHSDMDVQDDKWHTMVCTRCSYMRWDEGNITYVMYNGLVSSYPRW